MPKTRKIYYRWEQLLDTGKMEQYLVDAGYSPETAAEFTIDMEIYRDLYGNGNSFNKNYFWFYEDDGLPDYLKNDAANKALVRDMEIYDELYDIQHGAYDAGQEAFEETWDKYKNEPFRVSQHNLMNPYKYYDDNGNEINARAYERLQDDAAWKARYNAQEHYTVNRKFTDEDYAAFEKKYGTNLTARGDEGRQREEFFGTYGFSRDEESKSYAFTSNFIHNIDKEFNIKLSEEEITVEKKVNTTAASKTHEKVVYVNGKRYDSYEKAIAGIKAETGVEISTKTIQRGIDDGKSHKGFTFTSKAPAKNYWIKRESHNLLTADAYATKAAEETQKVLKECYQKCEAELDAFFKKLEDGYVPSKSELIRMDQYQIMSSNIKKHIEDAGLKQIKIVSGELEDVAAFMLNGYSKEQIEAFAMTEWNGINYSQRIWKNTEILADKARDAVEDAIVLGKSYKSCSRDLAAQMTSGRNVAERLIRTETSRVYNKAEIQEYKDAGIEYVEFAIEPDACDECKAFKGKKWKLGEQPVLPVHPQCRCDMLPVV